MRHQWHQRLYQLQVGLVEGDVDLAMGELVDLRMDSFVDCWVGVTEIGDTNTTCEVQVFASLGGSDVATSAIFEHVGSEAANAFCNVLCPELGELGEGHCGE